MICKSSFPWIFYCVYFTWHSYNIIKKWPNCSINYVSIDIWPIFCSYYIFCKLNRIYSAWYRIA